MAEDKVVNPMDRPPEQGGPRSYVETQRAMGNPNFGGTPPPEGAAAAESSTKEGQGDGSADGNGRKQNAAGEDRADSDAGGASPSRGADGKFVKKDAAAATPEDKAKPDAKHPGRGKPGAEERIAQLTREKGEAQRRLDETQRELEAYKRGERKPDAAAGGAAAELSPEARFLRDYDAAHPEPTLDAHPGDPDAYYKAQIDHGVDRKLALRDFTAAEDKKRLTAAEQREKSQEQVNAFFERGAEKYPDWEEALTEQDRTGVKFSAVAQDAILSSDVGEDIAHYLARSPDEALRISRLGPAAQAREIGKIERDLTAQAESAPKPKADEPAPAGARPAQEERPARSRTAEPDDPIGGDTLKGRGGAPRDPYKGPLTRDSLQEILERQQRYRDQR